LSTEIAPASRHGVRKDNYEEFASAPVSFGTISALAGRLSGVRVPAWRHFVRRRDRAKGTRRALHAAVPGPVVSDAIVVRDMRQGLSPTHSHLPARR
jgi:hypothetical protein